MGLKYEMSVDDTLQKKIYLLCGKERKLLYLKHTQELQKKIFKQSFVMMMGITIIIAIVSKKPLPIVYALVFGTLISMLNFRALALTMEKATQMPSAKAQSYATRQYFIRFTTNAIIIFVSIRAEYLNVIGVIIGLLIIKFVILGSNLFDDRSYYKRIFSRKEGK